MRAIPARSPAPAAAHRPGCPLQHYVVEHDPIVVIDDLRLVTELDRFPESALRDRPGVPVVQANPPSRPRRRDPGQPLPVCSTTRPVDFQNAFQLVTAPLSRPLRRSRPRRNHRRGQLLSPRCARAECSPASISSRCRSAAVLSATSSSSPVIRCTVRCASSWPYAAALPQIRRDLRARASRRRARGPAPWCGRPRPRPESGDRSAIRLIALTSRPESVWYFTSAGTTVVSVRTRPVFSSFACVCLAQQRLVAAVHRAPATPRRELPQRRRVRHLCRRAESGRTAARWAPMRRSCRHGPARVLPPCPSRAAAAA